MLLGSSRRTTPSWRICPSECWTVCQAKKKRKRKKETHMPNLMKSHCDLRSSATWSCACRPAQEPPLLPGGHRWAVQSTSVPCQVAMLKKHIRFRALEKAEQRWL